MPNNKPEHGLLWRGGESGGDRQKKTMSNSNHNERDKKNNSNSGEPSKGVLRLTDPDIAPSVRGLIVILILFKLITVNALKGRNRYSWLWAGWRSHF